MSASAGFAALRAAAGENSSAIAGADWPTVGGDRGNMRYSQLSQINTRNIKTLKGAWLRELGMPTRAAPVVSDGVMYITDPTTVYALNLENGKSLWEFSPTGGVPARGGVAVAQGLVFVGLSNAQIIAIDQKAGSLVWTADIGNHRPGVANSNATVNWGNITFDPTIGFISNAPLYADGLLFSGLTGSDAGVRGKVSALDARTGKLVWNFYTTPSPGDKGSETWPKNYDPWVLGGGAVWTNGAVDVDLGQVYYGTGNAVPDGGELRPGDNLFTASIVSLDLRTGRLKWYYQLVHHDLWDMDTATPLILYETRVKGQKRKALAAMRTDGYLFQLDRETGQPIFPVEERPVKQDIRVRTAPTQPFPVGADELGTACVDPASVPMGFEFGCFFDPPYIDRPALTTPFITTRQAPMSYDPQTGYFYVMGMVTPWSDRRPGNAFSVMVTHPAGAKQYGLYAAIDSRTERIVWQHRSPWDLAGGGGALTTAGGLLFHTEGDGVFQAHDAKSGKLLWHFQTGFVGVPGVLGLAGGVPAVSYEFRGAQYIAVPMGRGVWAFKLGGTESERPAPPAPPREYSFAGVIQQLPDDGSGEIAMSGLFMHGEHFIDEYALVPTRASVKAGVRFKLTNLGVESHQLVSADGTWSSGEIVPGRSIMISIANLGTYTYFCKNHPWSKGQLIVTAASDPTTVSGHEQGKFTSDQATRGKTSFESNCTAGCHMADLTPADRAPALAGDTFMQHWRGLSVGDLFERIRNTMPQQKPHSLSDQVYADIVSYLLQANGEPSGSDELKSDVDSLKQLKLKVQ